MIRSPQGTGAIFPSSSSLAKRIVRMAGVAEADRVVEIGPGTGAFTFEILATMRKDTRFFAVERNAAFVQHLRNRFPNAQILEGCATNLGELLRANGIENAESLVSGLPWANFNTALQTQILTAIQSAMSPGATFTTFAYFGPHLLPSGQRFRSVLHGMFPVVETSPVEMRNFPPAFVYYCKS
ncbi:MAG: class I SAM-dependent methyltransferase [Chthoniobacterales bacterium]